MSGFQRELAFTTFGELLRHLRKRAGMTQRDLGQAVGYSEAHIARLESGIRLPDVVVVKGALVEALDLTHEPALAAQLVALAQAAHGTSEAKTAPPIGNLPMPATTLIGRERDITLVIQRLAGDTTRVVTLVGPGGVGKTQLALEVAHQVQHRYHDGAWWVDLAPVTEPQAALTSIAQALQIVDRPGKPVLRELQDHLRDKQALLVLDNLEQVMDIAPLLAQVLSAVPALKVLATSRELLRIAGEQAFTVQPLGDIAVELFAQRARAVLPDFSVDDANAATVTEICCRLDGLPLAIELAAARITLFTPLEMLARLDHSLSLLTGGARDLPARQRTLRAALDWSYRLLTPAEQALFRRLGVFAGSYSLNAVQALCDADALPLSPEDGLAALISRSLLIRELSTSTLQADETRLSEALSKAGASRYRMLETIREYARELMLESGEYDRWVRVMAEYLLSLHAFVQRDLPDERANYMSALQWLNATNDETDLALRLVSNINAFTTSRDEQLLCLEQAIRRARVPKDSEHLIFAQAMHGIAIGNRGDRVQAIAILNETLAWYQAHGDRPDAIQGIHYVLGILNRDLNHIELSRQHLIQSLSIARARNDKEELRHLLITLAETEIADENAAGAERRLDEGMAVLGSREDATQAWALNHRAHAAMLRGDDAAAVSLLTASMQWFAGDDYQGEWGIAWNKQSLGELALSRGDAAGALAWFTDSMKCFDDRGDRMGVSWCLCGLAGASVLNNDAAHGARLWGAGEALREQIGCRIAPASRKNRERTEAILREQLGESAFVRLVAEGRAWPAEQAVAEALHTQHEK